MQKIILDNALDYDFRLIAIHGSTEPYYLAFLLNKHLGLQLARSSDDLVIFHESVEIPFARYEFVDDYHYIDYYLLSNKVKIEKEAVAKGLFEEERAMMTAHFIREMPQVDYFIKVVEDGYAFAKAKTIKILNQIPQIVTAYEVDVDQIKSKQNLIFE